MSRNSPIPASISSLPEEIIAQILDCFDTDPPSITQGSHVPSVDLLYVHESPLKASSLTCRMWRRIAFLPLFKCVRAPLEDVLPVWLPRSETGRTTDKKRLCVQKIDWIHAEHLMGDLLLPLRAIEFFDFIQANRLSDQLRSLTLFSQTELLVGIDTFPLAADAPAGMCIFKESAMKIHKNLAISSLWRHLLRQVDPEILLVFAPPRTLGCLILDCAIFANDSWAFNIQCQRLELRQNKNNLISSAATPPMGESDITDYASGGGLLAWDHETMPRNKDLRDVFRLRDWTDLSYHGGSCLSAYGTYHYFEKMPPCFLTYNPYLANSLGPKLTHFSYTTVFAHVVHFRRIISLILKLESLQSLSMQLAPAPDSNTLDDLDLIGKGNLRLPDCWMEVERAYSEVIRSVLTKLPLPVLEKLTTFTSYDCRKGALKEELEAAFDADAPYWTKTGEFTWVFTKLPEPALVEDVEMVMNPVEVS